MKAEPLIQRVLSTLEAVLGTNHPDVVDTLDNLATLYTDQGLYSKAEPLLQRALSIRETSLDPKHPGVANSLSNLARLYRDQGAYGRAEPLFQRALALREAAFGKSHPNVADSLNGLALLYHDQGMYGRAELLLQRALALYEAAFGPSHPDVAGSLYNLARIYHAQGLYDQAELLYQRALALFEATLGTSHFQVARSLSSLARIYNAQGQYSRAEPLLQRALALRETALGKGHPEVAYLLSGLAGTYKAQGQYSRAEPLFQRALALRETALGKSHPSVANSLNDLANFYSAQGQYNRAEPLLQRALALREAALGKSHPDVADSLYNLAGLHNAQGLYNRAEPLYLRALALREAALGKSHPYIADSLNGLATLYSAQGLYNRAEPLLQRALALCEAVFGKSHPHVASPLIDLATLYSAQGAYDRAEPLLQRALALREAAFGKSHPRVADPLNNLATLYSKQGLYNRAEPLLQRALALFEAELGKNHPYVAIALSNLATLYKAKGKYDRAEPLYQRALALFEAASGKSHPNVANSLNNLALLHVAQGLYDRAEPFHQRALALREAAFGKNHPHVANSLNNLAMLRMAQRRFDEALPLFRRAFSISEQRLRHEALVFSESRLSSFVDYLNAMDEAHYTLLHALPQNTHAQQLALSTALLRKGRSGAETAKISHTIHQSLLPEDHLLFEQLRNLRTQLAALSFSGPGDLSPKNYQERIQALSEEGDTLEARLAQHSSALRALSSLPSPDDIVGRVAATLPKDGALVEFVAYYGRTLLFQPGTSPSATRTSLRYLAIVLFSDGATRAADLGPAAPIDTATARLRAALSQKDVSIQDSAQELHHLVFQPLHPLLGHTRRLLVSPDGQLGLIPFAALHDGQDFLLDSYDFTYLTSGTQLLTSSTATPASSIIVLADPDFFASPPVRLPSSDFPPPDPSSELFARILSRSGQPTTSWQKLPGTRLEAEAIQRLLPQAQLFLGAQANKQQVLHLPTPGILHVATHGFFLGDAPPSQDARGLGSLDGLVSERPQPKQEPLLNSGLVLSGATNPAASVTRNDSLVTALELAGLNFWGTQLVVLSACDSGRGEVRIGQGILGLRRALVVAGAETVVMSLWQVNDDSTRLLMDAYYRSLLAGRGRSSALRDAMRSLRVSRPHPYHWAPFIALGSDAPLHAIVPARARHSVSNSVSLPQFSGHTP